MSEDPPRRAGDFGVVRTPGLVGALIRLGTRSQVSHAFVVVTADGGIVEARARGASRGHLSEYHDRLVVFSRFDLSDAQRRSVASHAVALLGTPYNWLDLLALALVSLGMRWRWALHRAQASDRLICSQLVDRAYHDADLELFSDGRPDGSVTPGDLLMLIAEGRPPAEVTHHVSP